MAAGNGGKGTKRTDRASIVARDAARPPVVDREGASIALRLAIGREGLGLELARNATLGCLDVVELVVRLPHVRFPFDVTGGVTKFRHKRGELQRIAIELDARKVARWAEPRLRGLVSAEPARVDVALRRSGATLTVSSRTSAAGAGDRALPALAFDVAFLPRARDVVLVVHRARGIDLPAPATKLALDAMRALFGPAARRSGCRFVVAHPAAKLAGHVLPDAGARAPEADDVVLVGAGESDGVLFMQFARNGALADVAEEATRAIEAADLVTEADDLICGGDFGRARELVLAAATRAPRHPELARRIAEIDRHVGGREEAAVTVLREAAAATNAALLGDLLQAANDPPGAIAALLRAADHESSATLAALVLARAASIATTKDDALAWLDAAIARAPRIAELRWARAAHRLEAGRLADARADFQELEALANAPYERFEVLRRAAETYRVRGLSDVAASVYERSLLYRPDDPAALAGLGAALATEGRAARGAAILAHAITTAAARGLPTAWMELELGKTLGERLADLPAAVARLRAIPDEPVEAIEARGLEGRYRARLGDAAGASLAFARLRERAGRDASALPWLLEAATFEAARESFVVAQSHAAAALAIAPRDEAALRLHRELGETIAARAGLKPVPAPARVVAPPTPPEPAIIGDRASDVDRATTMRVEPAAMFEAAAMDVFDGDGDGGDAELEGRVEVLTQRLQGDPTNDAVVDELVRALTKLGRYMDLLALLSARLEDAPPGRREALLPHHREVLQQLEANARAAGREAEAELFKLAREAS